MSSHYSAIDKTLSLFTLPQASGKILDFETSPDTITIVRTSDFNHYIEPPREPGSIRNDLIMTGFVIVHMSKLCRARKLSVRFLTETTLAFPGELIYNLLSSTGAEVW
jgi:hypothetical protein